MVVAVLSIPIMFQTKSLLWRFYSSNIWIFLSEKEECIAAKKLDVKENMCFVKRSASFKRAC